MLYKVRIDGFTADSIHMMIRCWAAWQLEECLWG
ncbi:hypothetical protein WG8_1060 [Paenibacillus sp. Aloe-11]|nr:hypothetical protein WG8_1060 [Paenibacillus sp. Aloe-11]